MIRQKELKTHKLQLYENYKVRRKKKSKVDKIQTFTGCSQKRNYYGQTQLLKKIHLMKT